MSDTTDALPGIHRIGVPGVQGPRASGSAHGRYGFTEPQGSNDSAHHQLSGIAAAAVAPWSFAALGVRADFRHDVHGSDTEGSDSGSVLDVTPLVRVGHVLPIALHLGAEARVRLPGATNGENGISPELDARLLSAYSGLETWVFALHAGYRVGHRGSAREDAAGMRPGDRIALGLSEYDALLLGVGGLKTVGKTDVFGEVTGDFLLGGPPVVESPLRLALGIRQPLREALWLQGVVEANVGDRAPATPADPLVPIEPRVQGMLGLIFRFLQPAPPARAVPEVKPLKTPKAAPVAKPKPAPPPVITSPLQITIVDKTGHPISDARVSVQLTDPKTSQETSVQVPLQERNVYSVSEVPVGDVELTIAADLLKPHTQTVRIIEGHPTEVEVALLPAATLGSQLRGLVRSYSGEGIPARVRVEPGEASVDCGPDGSFELELPPDTYTVIIEAEGYRPQRRTLRIRKEGVTVLNADLQQSAP